MFADLLTALKNFCSVAYEAFAAPGFFLFQATLAHTPGLAALLKFDSPYAPTLVVFLLSLLYWFLLAVLLTLVVRIGMRISWQIGALVRTGVYRLTHHVRSIKTALILKVRERFPRRREKTTEVPMIEFNKLDIAVLRRASAISPGLALSAPDLAELFKLRPSQVQKSLDKLTHNKMLIRVIGATDGYENFRVTDSGVAFIAMWQRQLSGAG